MRSTLRWLDLHFIAAIDVTNAERLMLSSSADIPQLPCACGFGLVRMPEVTVTVSDERTRLGRRLE